ELEQRVRAVGARLQDAATPGDRALLLYPPGLDFVVALFACFRAGVVAVPAYPPDPARLDRTLPRLLRMVEDAPARLLLTLGSLRALAGSAFAQAPAPARLRWVATDETDSGLGFRELDIAADSVALLQYTSGSTREPRGVVVTHANLLANSAFIHRAF